GPGSRIYVGPRIVGRYTLAPVRDPEATVVFLATGTGEAPHNAMITELLRKGHHGPIVSVVCVRYRADLAYLEKHRRLEERFPNYHYMPLVTASPTSKSCTSRTSSSAISSPSASASSWTPSGPMSSCAGTLR